MPEMPAPTMRTSRCSTGVGRVIRAPASGTAPSTVEDPAPRGQHGVRRGAPGVVHDEPVTPAWPRPSATVRELFRRGAEVALDPRADWVAELHRASLSGA